MTTTARKKSPEQIQREIDNGTLARHEQARAEREARNEERLKIMRAEW